MGRGRPRHAFFRKLSHWHELSHRPHSVSARYDAVTPFFCFRRLMATWCGLESSRRERLSPSCWDCEGGKRPFPCTKLDTSTPFRSVLLVGERKRGGDHAVAALVVELTVSG